MPATSPASHRRRARHFLTRLLARAAVVSVHGRPTCPICLDVVAAEACVTLHCGHQFCIECVRSYAQLKVRDRQVGEDQLVCPVVECKRSLNGRDLRRVLDRETHQQYKRTAQRLRDEKSPLARWCPRPQCGELVLCASNSGTFRCHSCGAVGCFHCRGPAHRFSFICSATPLTREDASYVKWEKSVGDGHAVRACPRCQMRIWKIEGCNHMKCAHCYHEYCWVCDANWHRRHYACGEERDPRSSLDAFRRRAAQLEMFVLRLIVALLACVSAIVLAPVFAVIALARAILRGILQVLQAVPRLFQFMVMAVKVIVAAVAALVALPFLIILAVWDAVEEKKPLRRRRDFHRL